MVSYLLGMRRHELVFTLLKKIVIMATGGVMVLVLLSLFVPEALIRIYTDHAGLISLSIPVLMVVNIGAVFLSTGFVLFNGVMGTGKTNVSFLIEMVVLSLYLLYVLIMVRWLGGGVATAWTAEILYGVLLSGLSLLYLRYGKWRSHKL